MSNSLSSKTRSKKFKIVLVLFVLIIVAGMIQMYMHYSKEKEAFKKRQEIKKEKKIETIPEPIMKQDQVAVFQSQFNKLQKQIENFELDKEAIAKSQQLEFQKIVEKIDDVKAFVRETTQDSKKDLNKVSRALKNSDELTQMEIEKMKKEIKKVEIKAQDGSLKNIKLPDINSLENPNSKHGLNQNLMNALNEDLRPNAISSAKKDELPELVLYSVASPKVDTTKTDNQASTSKTASMLKNENNSNTTTSSTDETSEEESNENDTKEYTLNLGFMKGITLMGVDAPTTSEGESNPYPVLLSVDGGLINANNSNQSLDKCFILSTATGDLRTHRVNLRLSKLSCVTADNKYRFESKIQGWVIGEDGKPGIPGKVVTKAGTILAKGIMAGFLQGIANAFSKAPTFLSSSGADGNTIDSPEASFSEGFAEGSGDALGKIADYYIEQAKDIYPVVVAKGGRKITILIKGGEKLKPVPFNRLFIGDTYETNLNKIIISDKNTKVRKRL
ncbi:MAG: TrbI/VirB10 family protein [Halarcobacter sp.]